MKEEITIKLPDNESVKKAKELIKLVVQLGDNVPNYFSALLEAETKKLKDKIGGTKIKTLLSSQELNEILPKLNLANFPDKGLSKQNLKYLRDNNWQERKEFYYWKDGKQNRIFYDFDEVVKWFSKHKSGDK